MAEPRQIAVAWLVQVVDQGVSVNQLLAADKSELTAQQQALAKQLLFGCLRYYQRLKTLADNLLNKPFKTKDNDLLMVIVSGIYQLKYLSTPDHAAISESVELTRKLNKSWASGLVNGVLRRYQRESNELEQSLAKSVQFQFSHPGWIVKRLRQDWPNEAEAILEANNKQAPMILRVNTQKNSREAYLECLAKAEIAAKPHQVAPDGILLDKAIDVYKLPGFEAGLVTVQDAAAQLAVEMLDLKPALRVLDGCAAPGGKTTHLLQRAPDAELTAVELSPKRAEKIEQTLARLDMQCRVKMADICELETWWDEQSFDRILLDVPCSASGVIRRNPDIKVHRRTTDIKPLVELQSQILNCGWQLLKPGGVLVYATCSVFKDENEHQIENFLSQNAAQVLSMPMKIHEALVERTTLGYQILPGEMGMDGFYLCGLRKPD